MKLRPCIAGLAALLLFVCIPVQASTSSYFQRMIDSTVHVSFGRGVGSGFMLTPTMVITAAHVARGASPAKITTQDGNKAYSLPLRVSEIEKEDFAILALYEPLWSTTVKVNCELPEIGDQLYGVGHPLGLDASVSFLRVVGSLRASPMDKEHLAIQVQGTVVPGMSGGPVFNTDGEVVGLFSAMMITGSGGPFGQSPIPAGYGYIIPASQWCHLLPPKIGEDKVASNEILDQTHP